MTREALAIKIRQAFKGVTLEDGIGLWEAQGHDDYATAKECAQLRLKDEKHDWSKIPLINLYKCSSSLSFFDAKGMRFHLPQFLLFDIDIFEAEEDELHKKGLLEVSFCPDVFFSLSYTLDEPYSIQRFSALNAVQIAAILHYFDYKIKERENYYKAYQTNAAIADDDFIKEIQAAKAIWIEKLNSL